jgi:hypothetical protein
MKPEKKLVERFNKFKKQYYKWLKYFERPKQGKLYTKETKEFDEMLFKGVEKRYTLLQKKMDKLKKVNVKQVDIQTKEDIKQKLLAGNKKILLVDCYAHVKFIDSTTKWLPLSFKFHLKAVSYKGQVLKDFVKDKIVKYILNNYEVADVLDIKFNYFNLEHVYMSNIKHGKVSLQYKFLNDLNGIQLEKEYDDNCCVIRHIYDSCKQTDRFKRLTEEKLKEQFTTLNINYEKGISVDEQIGWIKRFFPNSISLYALDPYYNVFEKYTAKQPRVSLVYLCNNKHIYVINDEICKKYISKAKHLDQSIDIGFKHNYNKYEYINDNCKIDKGDLDCYEDLDGSLKQVDKMNDEQINNEIEKYNEVVEGKRNGEVFLVNNIYQCALDVMEKNAPYTISNFKVKDSQISSFIHPVSGKVIENGQYYDQRLEMCNKLYEQFQCENFKFKNQTFSQMAIKYSEIKFGKLYKKSSYTDEHLRLLDEFYTTPLMRTLVRDHQYNDHCKAFDINMCYTNAVLNMIDDYPVFTKADDIKKYNGEDIVCGEYLVNGFSIKQLGGIHFPKQWLSHNIVRKFVNKGYLDKGRIILVAKASLSYKPDTLHSFMKDVLELFPRSKYGNATKILCNAFIGMLGKRYHKLDKGFITNDYDTVQAMFCMYPTGFNMNQFNDFYFVRNTLETRLDKDHGAIFRQILCQGMLSVVELLEQVYGNGSRLISYKTDAVFVENPIRQIHELDQTKYKAEKWKPFVYVPYQPREGDDTVSEIQEWNKLEDVQFKGANIIIKSMRLIKYKLKYLETLKNISFCCIGAPGCQKTTLLKKNYVHGETLVLCYTNKACQNIIQALGNNANVHTFDSKFWKQEDATTTFVTIKRILIDEFSMIPLKWIEKLYQLKKDNNIVIQFYGDPNQCAPVDVRYMNYMNKKVFRWMCDYNLMEKEYVEGCGRYDRELYDVLEYLKIHHQLPEWLSEKKSKSGCGVNICRTNKLRKIVNSKFHKGYFVGQKIISNKNNKAKGVFNSRFYYIHSILNDRVTLSETIDGKPFTGKKGIYYFNVKDIDPAYCVTCYKYQGDTIETDYNIYELNKMSFNELYTSLSRGRTLDKIHFKYTNKVFNSVSEPIESTTLFPVTLNKGEIYECYNEQDNLYYIGYTTTSTEQRFKEHCEFKDDPIFKSGGKEKWTSRKIIDYYFDKEDEIRKVEGFYIKEYYNNNYTLVNTQKVPKQKSQ